jgi:phosphatidate phosphatase LPIN
MTDLVDQMFPPINRTMEPEYTDFSFWRAPVSHFELPDLAPPSPALSARSDSSRLGLGRLGNIASSLSRRSSRAALTDRPALISGGSSGISRGSRAGTPSSPLLQATVMEEQDNGSDDEDGGRSESESMPGSLPNASDFEKYRAAVERSNRRRRDPEAGQTNDPESGRGDDDEGEEEAPDEDETREDDNDDFGEELDFTSVPVCQSFSF